MNKFVSLAAGLALMMSAMVWAIPTQAAASRNPSLKGISLESLGHDQYQAKVWPQAGVAPRVVSPDNLYYQFKVESPSGQWHTAQAYGHSPNLTFAPAPKSHGLYFVEAFALTEPQLAMQDWSQAVSTGPIPVPAPNHNPNISINASHPTGADTFALAASVKPANTPVEYQVELRAPSGRVSVIRAFSTSKTVTYVPHAPGFGLIVVALTKAQVQQKRWSDEVDRYFKLVMKPQQAPQPKPNPAFVQAGVVDKGRLNIFHASSSPKPGIHVEYAFRVETPKGTWTVARSYSPSPWFVYTPPASGYHMQILALTAYQVKHKEWNLAETSDLIAVPVAAAPSSLVTDAAGSTATAVADTGIRDTLQVTVSGPSQQALPNEPVSFVSSNPQVASPNTYAVLTDKYGQATVEWTPVGPGTATITATCGDLSTTFTVTVEQLVPTVQLLMGVTAFDNTYMWPVQVTDQLNQVVEVPPAVTIVDTSTTPEVTYSLANKNMTIVLGQQSTDSGLVPAYEVTVTPQGTVSTSDNLVMTVDGVSQTVHF